MKKALGLFFFLAVLAGLTAAYASWVAGRMEREPPAFERGLATVQLGNGTVVSFNAEIARTPEEQAYGLMFRKSMGKDQGMCFLFEPPKPVSFWMKDTLIPLDMLFMRPGGEIASIVAAKPLDEKLIMSGEPVEAVLEINSGLAAQLGIREGDHVTCSGGAKR